MMTPDPRDFQDSGFRAKVIEDAFLADLLQEAYIGFGKKVEVHHTMVDENGYDVILELGNVLRHVQLKSARMGSKTSDHAIHKNLAKKPAGAVILMLWREDKSTNRYDFDYLFYGGKPGEKLELSDTVAKHNGKARPNHIAVKKSEYTKIDDMPTLLSQLFGDDQFSAK